MLLMTSSNTAECTYKCRYQLRSTDSDVFDALKHVHLLLHFESFNHVAQRTDQPAARCTVPVINQLTRQSINKAINQCTHFVLTAIPPGKPGFAGVSESKVDGSSGNNWSYKSCKAPVKSSSPTNQHPTFYRRDALPVAQPTVLKH